MASDTRTATVPPTRAIRGAHYSTMMAKPAAQSTFLSKQFVTIYAQQIQWQPQIEPATDGVAYSVDGSTTKFCRPQVRVARRTEGFQVGPEIRFLRSDAGEFLVVVFEENPESRPSGTVPFVVRAKTISLIYGSGADQTLNFPTIEMTLRPDPQSGPAFRLECQAPVPQDDRRARLLAAMQQLGSGTKWNLVFEFDWIQVVYPPSPPPRPAPRPIPQKPHMAARIEPGGFDGEGFRKPVRIQKPIFDERPIDHAPIDVPPPSQSQPRPQHITKVIAITRTLDATYPTNTAENRSIYAAIDQSYALLGWRKTAAGWFLPTPIQDTVFTVPDAYRIDLDDVSGMPAIQAVLLRKNAAGDLQDDLDPSQYKIRLTLRVKPDFDPDRMNSLRKQIFDLSSREMPYADLVLGGYDSARFVADRSLAGLGEMFSGTTAGDQENINPEAGFTLTYEGNAEFADLLFERIKGEGIGGNVELALKQPDGTTRNMPIPVELTLRRLSPPSLPIRLRPETAADTSTKVSTFEIKNPSTSKVQIEKIETHALHKSSVTGKVQRHSRGSIQTLNVEPGSKQGNLPLILEPGEALVLSVKPEETETEYNFWDLALIGVRPALRETIVLNHLFDAATSGVRGWKVDVDCPAWQFYDQLKDEEKREMDGLANIEVEVRRQGFQDIEEVRLTKAKPSGVVLLSRTVGDFVSDRSVGRSTFEYRCRPIKIGLSSNDTPTEWQQETGKSLSITGFLKKSAST